jgi:hypothetical protein
VQSAMDAVPLAEFEAVVGGLLGQLEAVLGTFQTALSSALGGVHALLDALESIDLRAGARPALDLIRSTTESVRSINASLVAESDAGTFRLSVSVLADIDLAPVRTQLVTAFDAADPTPVLRDLETKVQDLIGRVAALDPAALLAPLATPFAQVQGALAGFDPGALLDPLLAQLRVLRAELAGLEGRLGQAMAPLRAPHAQALSALGSVAPSVLLAPLPRAYAELEALFEKADIRPLLGEVETLMTELFEYGLGGLQAAGDTLGGAADLRAFMDGVGGGIDHPELGFRPGDPLLIAQQIFDKIVDLLSQVPAATLVGAIGELRDRFVDGLDAIDPARLAAHVDRALRERVSAFQLSGEVDAVREVYARYSELVLAFDSIDEVEISLEARADYDQCGGLVASVNPELSMAPARPAVAGVDASVVGVVGSLDVTDLAPSFAPLRTKLDQLVPPFLHGELDVAAILEGVQALSPAIMAAEVNAEFEAFLLKVHGLGATLAVELPALAQTLEGGFTSFLPDVLREMFEALYLPLMAQLQALDPGPIITEVEAEVYAPVVAALEAVGPDALLAELNLAASIGTLTGSLDGVIAELEKLRNSIGAAANQLRQAVAVIDPAKLGASLGASFQAAPVALVADVAELRDRLERLIARIREDLERVLADAEGALQELLAALPS